MNLAINIEGDLRYVALPKVLQRVGALGRNGILTLQGEDDIVAVSFLKGAIVTADALNQTVEDGLGKVLQNQGLINAEDFAAVARDHQGGSAGSLGEVLVKRGMISRTELLDGLRVQTLRQMLQVLTWRSGEFKFYGGDEVSYEEGFVPISVEELLLRGVEKLGERAGLPGTLPELDGTFRKVPPRGALQILDRDGDGSGLGIWLTEQQAGFLARLDGLRHAFEIGRDLGLDRHKIQFGLYLFLFYDLIEQIGRSKVPIDPRERQIRPDPRLDLSSTAIPIVSQAPRPAPAQPAPPPAAAPSPSQTIAFAPGRPTTAPRTAIPSAPGPPQNLQFPGLQPTASPSAGPAPAHAGQSPLMANESAGELRAEIFLPPEGMGTRPLESPAIELPQSRGISALRWVGPALAAVLIVGAALYFVVRPAFLLLPFPWSSNPRVAIERNLRDSLFYDIDRQAKTYFLISAHYPDSLEDLIDSGLIARRDLRDPAGYSLEYVSEDLTYQIRIKDGDETIEGLGNSEAITGDFFVDPQFLRSGAIAESPLVFIE